MGMRPTRQLFRWLVTYSHVIWPYVWLSLVLLHGVQCMSDVEINALREETRGMFYHGLDNYYKHAYPEDELRPLTCRPLTRDRHDPSHIELNDALGNYSLSLVDSLSTLAILASNPKSTNDKHDALRDFQEAVVTLIADYGDGSSGPHGQGRRARGFDLDSKVQVFETTIRGVGGLLSAHLFATGDLPIRGYNATARQGDYRTSEITWDVKGSWGRHFVYDGQLLRLAIDLAQRILPSFATPTGIPYPRVNLRHGIGFYKDHLPRADSDPSQCPIPGEPIPTRERTETCSAGAGSLILEFATLSHLTGNPVYLKVANKAFQAIWDRRSTLDLVGSGIDAETGMWVSPVTGIGAGIDSFFEYAFKTHILLSGRVDREERNLSDSFLRIWQDAHTAISRNIHRGSQHQHPHYAQNDKDTGGLRYTWIDSLSAFYPGLLALAGEIEEAQSTHLLYAALWTRYGALPERWNVMTGEIESGLRWWGGRPEFIESTWYLYRATQDPWYLRVGEMVLRDIKRRCYTPCGWAGLQDVTTGEKTDRMESFFLGETIKYLYLLFDKDHPLNYMDANYVFTTEGHPLILPNHDGPTSPDRPTRTHVEESVQPHDSSHNAPQCPIPAKPSGLLGSVVASRADLFHAAVASKLISKSGIGDQVSLNAHPATKADQTFVQESDNQRRSEHGFYPWTMPDSLIPSRGFSARLNTPRAFELTFPMAQNGALELGALQRVDGGILINAVNGLRFGLVLDSSHDTISSSAYRIHSLSNLPLGRDEKIWLGSEVVNQLQPLDSQLSRVKDLDAADLYIDAPEAPIEPVSPINGANVHQHMAADLESEVSRLAELVRTSQETTAALPFGDSHIDALYKQILAAFPTFNIKQILESSADPATVEAELFKASRDLLAHHNPQTQQHPDVKLTRHSTQAALCAGPGAAPIPQDLETTQPRAIPATEQNPTSRLPYRRVYVLDSELCDVSLPVETAKRYQVLVIRRGGCRFDDKLRRIPSFAPSLTSLKLVVVVSFPAAAADDDDASARRRRGDEDGDGVVDEDRGSGRAVRPLLETLQVTPSGVKRRHPIPVVMVGGGRKTWDVLERAAMGTGAQVDGQIVEVKGADGGKPGDEGYIERGGVGIRRRYWFESEGIRVANLLVH